MYRLLFLLGVITMSFATQAAEEPDHEVLRTFENVEVRQYAPYVVAEVLVEGSADQAGSEAFPL